MKKSQKMCNSVLYVALIAEGAQLRPGDVTFHLPLTDLRIFVDHTTTSIFTKSAALPEKPEDLPMPGSLAFGEEEVHDLQRHPASTPPRAGKPQHC